jgi:hypothetical protein
MEKSIYIKCDLKWLAMLLGMEDHSSSWYLHCFFVKEAWQDEGLEDGLARMIAFIKEKADLRDSNPPNPNKVRQSSRMIVCLYYISQCGWVFSMTLMRGS